VGTLIFLFYLLWKITTSDYSTVYTSQPAGVSCAMSPASKRHLSGPTRTFMMSLHSRTMQGSCVASRRCDAFDRKLKNNLVYLFVFFTLGKTNVYSLQLVVQPVVHTHTHTHTHAHTHTHMFNGPWSGTTQVSTTGCKVYTALSDIGFYMCCVLRH